MRNREEEQNDRLQKGAIEAVPESEHVPTQAEMTKGDDDCLTESLLSGALKLAERGYPVFPCKPQGKKPLTLNGFKDATTNQLQIRTWWKEWPEANVAVPTGMKTFHVLDIDQKEGIDGEAALSALEKDHEKLPDTVEVITGSGGRHLYFEYKDGILGITAGQPMETADI